MEGVFANVKSNKGMRIFVIGRKNVGVRMLYFFTAHNIEKVIAAQLSKKAAA